MLAHDVEQAARLLKAEVPVEADREDTLSTPMPALRPVTGVDDDTLEGRPSQQFVDELLGAEELQITRFHAWSSKTKVGTSIVPVGVVSSPEPAPVGRPLILASPEAP